VSIRPLSHADLDAILAEAGIDAESLLAGTPADRPVVALRVRATVGRPGASAEATYQARRAGELAGWRRGLPWRAALTLAAGLTAGLLAPRLGLLAGVAPPAWPGGRCGFAQAGTPGRGGAAPQVSVAPRGCSPGWNAAPGASCTTWPSLAARPHRLR
jgi:hypothetical protein